MEEILKLKEELDVLYDEVVNGNRDRLEELDKFILKLASFDSFNTSSAEELLFIDSLFNSLIEKMNLICDLLIVKKENLLTMDNIREEFKRLELKRFQIVNNYVLGMVELSQINIFKEELFQFRNMLYAIPISDDNLLEIAKMKSKIQHFNTEVLEDEEILKQAYNNLN